MLTSMSKMDFQQLCNMTLLHFRTHDLLYSCFYYCFTEAKSLMLCKVITQSREENSVSGWSYKASGFGYKRWFTCCLPPTFTVVFFEP